MQRTLKLHIDTPPEVIGDLVIKHKYRVIQRIPSVGITLKKVVPNNEVVVQVDGLTPAQKYELESRCDRIVDWFPDPYASSRAVRTRLHNMRQSLRTIAEQQYVLEYMDENFPEDT